MSIIISNIVMWIIKLLTNYHELLKEMDKNIINKESMDFLFNKISKCIKVKILIYFF